MRARASAVRGGGGATLPTSFFMIRRHDRTGAAMAANDNKQGRREPTLGDLEHLEAPAPRPPGDALPPVKANAGDDRIGRAAAPRRERRAPRHRQPSRLRSWLWPLLVTLVVALLALAWVNQDALRALLPRTDLNATLLQADQALAAGHLEGTAGTSAHELYAKALAEEPDNGHALKGLRDVGEAELARASSAIRARDYQQAQVSLANARGLLGGGADVERVAAALQKAQHPTRRLNALIDRAQAALAAGHLTGDDGAPALYRQVLDVDPQNAVARHGLDRAGAALATRARSALQGGDLATATSLIGELGTWVPREGDLPSLKAELVQAQQQASAIQTHLAAGEADLRNGLFTGSDGNNALAEFQAVLKLDADNAQATAGLQQVARALVLRANAAIDAGDPAQARTLLDQAAQLAPRAPEVAVARSRLRGAAPASSQVAAAASAAGTAPTPLQQVEIGQLLQRARTAADAGNILLPPGASAYDLYRQVLTIDPGSAAAGAGLDALAGQVLQRFNEAMAAQRLDQAGSYFAAMQSLEPGSLRATTLAQRLGNAWLDRAQAAVAKGDDGAASKALDAARKYAPDAARLKSLEARVHGA